jgi:predicted NAD-dependent protein-ADP-ribosyltransferase YbiA (DUF1768 family)
MTGLLSLLVAFGIAAAQPCSYPAKWWTPVTEDIQDWEILPQSVSCAENKVILSKRTELGIFSNLAPTPFTLDGQKYASVEGFWQMMKYPENPKDLSDPRNQVKWPFTREQVSQMSGFDAKHAGDAANAILKKLGIGWLSYNGQRMEYRGKDQQAHYQIILRAMQAKLESSEVKRLLQETGNLELLPDHKQEPNSPPAYRYYDIWMKLRASIHSTTR